jgi:hypothetical protein
MKLRHLPSRLVNLDLKQIKTLPIAVADDGIHGIWRWLSPEINQQAVFIFGNQKSGTTAIAAILVAMTGLTATLDIHTWTVVEQDKLHLKTMTFEEFVQKHLWEFSADIIKEPGLTFLYDDVKRLFPFAQKVFIVRDPRDNIRSILNRVNRPGHTDTVRNFHEIPEAWQRILDNRWMGLDHEHFIDSLSARWNRSVDVFLDHQAEIFLLRYEDFVLNKAESIESLANLLEIQQVKDISGIVNVQYQPKGNRDVSWVDFFGKENLMRIERICGERMARFQYI